MRSAHIGRLLSALLVLSASVVPCAHAAGWGVYRSCAASESGRFSAMGRVDGSVELHDAELRNSRLLEAGSQAHFGSLRFALDDSYLVGADHHGLIVCWDLRSEFDLPLMAPHLLRDALERADFDVRDRRGRKRSLGWYDPPRLTISPDSSRFFAAWGDGRRQLYSRNGTLVAEYRDPPRKPEETEDGWRDLDPLWDSLDVEWGPGPHDMLVRLGDAVCAFDTRSGEPRRSNDEPHTIRTEGEPHACAFSPDGKHLAISYGNMRIGLFDYATGERLLDYQYTDPFFLAKTAVVHQLAFSASGDRLAFTSAGGAYVGILDATTFEELYDSDFRGGHFGEVERLTWLREVDALAYWYDCGGGLELLDLRTEPRRLDVRSVVWPCFHSRGVFGLEAQDGSPVQLSIDELIERGEFVPEVEGIDEGD